MKTKLFYSVMILFGILSSCTKDGVEIDNPKIQSTEIRTNRIAGRSPSVLDISSTRQNGKFKNPFYIGTVKNAYKKLKSQGVISNNYDIIPNALYVRYLPKDEAELNTLKMDENLLLSEDPLQENDNSVETGHDDIIRQNQLPFQYTTCGVGGIKPGIEVDILDTLFLNFPTTIITQDDWVKIEKEIMISTGVIGPNDPEFNAIPFCDDWFPSGSIRIWDDALSTNLPLKKLKVRIIKWYSMAEVYTNDSGVFTSPWYFCGKVRYTVRFEHNLWDIRDGYFLQADFASSMMRTPFNHIIKKTDEKHVGWGSMHRALVRYYFEDVAGLRRPHLSLGGKLKASYMHDSGTGSAYVMGLEGSYLSHVYVYGKDSDGIVRVTQRIYATTIHELAHIAHSNQMGNVSFWQVSNLLVESWARACQWKITELEYGNSPIGVPGSIQGWSFLSSAGKTNNYSPLFIDFEDNFNQNSTDSSLPNDVVSGYTLSLIQSNVLSDSYGLTSLRTRLKSQKPAGVTDAQVDMNLQYYFDNF